jgi:inorganic pyrophosphatase
MGNPAYFTWRPHPWHGLELGPNPPEVVNAYIEITPFDLVKYEVDKATGYLRADRPQRTSSTPPTLYGFIPRTYCGERVGKLSPGAREGDGDPLDICVISERPINKSEVIVRARVIGGLRTLDSGEADDKIVAVFENDTLWGEVTEVAALPGPLVDRLTHYFATYKLTPDGKNPMKVDSVYDRAMALEVVRAAVTDYRETFS